MVGWVEARGTGTEKKRKDVKNKNRGINNNNNSGTNKSFFDKVLKRKSGVCFGSRRAETRLFPQLGFLNTRFYHSPPLPHPPTHPVNTSCKVPLSARAAPLARPLPLRHEIALKTMLEFLITRIVKLKHRCELINNIVWGF